MFIENKIIITFSKYEYNKEEKKWLTKDMLLCIPQNQFRSEHLFVLGMCQKVQKTYVENNIEFVLLLCNIFHQYMEYQVSSDFWNMIEPFKNDEQYQKQFFCF